MNDTAPATLESVTRPGPVAGRVGRPSDWYLLPAPVLLTGQLFARSLTPYAPWEHRIVVWTGLAAMVALLVICGRRVDRAGSLRTPGTAALLAAGVVLAGLSLGHELNRRIDIQRICRQVTAPIDTVADLDRIEHSTLGEYVAAGADYRPADRAAASVRANAAGLGTEAFMVRTAVQRRAGTGLTALEQDRLRSQQSALAGACR